MANISEIAKRLLREKYQEKFRIVSAGKTYGTLTNDTFTVICTSETHPEILFQAEIEKDGAYLIDDYVNRLISKKIEAVIYEKLAQAFPEIRIEVKSGIKSVPEENSGIALEEYLKRYHEAKFSIHVDLGSKVHQLPPEYLKKIELAFARIPSFRGAIEIKYADSRKYLQVKDGALREFKYDYQYAHQAGLTDRDLLVATQVAYYDFYPEIIQANGYMATLREILMQDKSVEWKLRRTLKKAREKDDQYKVYRAVQALHLYEEIIAEHSPYGEWVIRDIRDDNAQSGFYGCLIQVGKNEAVIAFRGSESRSKEQIEKDWIQADLGLLNSVSTWQQQVAAEYVREISQVYNFKSYAISGHSLGGNLTAHAAIMIPEQLRPRLVKSINFDGPGFSEEYLKANQDKINKIGTKLYHYQWSLVGELLFSVPGSRFYSLRTSELVYGNYALEALVQKHDTGFVLFEANGSSLPGQMDKFAESIGNFSRGIDACPTWIGNSLVWLVSRLMVMTQEEKRYASSVIAVSLAGMAARSPALALQGAAATGMLLVCGYIIPDFYGKTLIPSICNGIGDAAMLPRVFRESVERTIAASSQISDLLMEQNIKWKESVFI